ncbi:viroplasmin family protein [Erysipelothrix rhusiopathiae]|nr:viroplasmin family protein [Erysipelothrix rhusiopathiae]
MAKKYYAVGVGRETGVFETWHECQEMTNKYKGSKFRVFESEEEAQGYVNSFANIDGESTEPLDYDLLVSKCLENGSVVAFTDGSYSGKTEEAGYGIYILTNEYDPIEISDKVYTEKFQSTNNIGPEIFAVLNALQWAASNEYKKITIFHDLQLIGQWADGSNRAKSEIGILFLRELNEKYKTLLDVDFVWVRGHSGNKYNEKADRLAADAVKNRKPVGKYGPNSFYGTGVSKRSVMEIIETFKEKKDIKFDESAVPGGHKYQFLKNEEKLTVTFFDRKEAIWLQGKVNSLFSEFLSYYTENISMFEMVKAYSDAYKVSIKAKEVDEFITSLNLPSNYPKAAITLLQQSFLMRNLNREEYDYSHYTSPAYRALEGHLKYLCNEAGFAVNRSNMGGQFNNNPNGDGTKVLSNRTLKSHHLSGTIENVYNLVYSKRHPVSHFGDILVEGFEDTLLIPDLAEAHARIDEVFKLIVFS